MLSSPSLFNAPSAASQPKTDSQYIQPTLNHGLRIWWAYYWPTTLAEAVLGFCSGFWLRVLYQNLTISSGAYVWAVRLQPFLLGVLISFFSINYILRRRFRRFRVAFVASSDYESTTILPVTIKRGLRVWWTFAWRTFVYSLALMFIASVSLGLLTGFLAGMGRAMAVIVPLVQRVLIAAVVSSFVIYSNILDEEFGEFRVVLLPRKSPATAAAATLPVERQTAG